MSHRIFRIAVLLLFVAGCISLTLEADAIFKAHHVFACAFLVFIGVANALLTNDMSLLAANPVFGWLIKKLGLTAARVLILVIAACCILLGLLGLLFAIVGVA